MTSPLLFADVFKDGDEPSDLHHPTLLTLTRRKKKKLFKVWDPAKHPRKPSGSPASAGGEFASTGMAGRSVTETPEFKAWFGDSKVIDATGKPLVMYHGTTGDFSEFDPHRSRGRIWAAASPVYANIYAGWRGGEVAHPGTSIGASPMGGNVMPIYMSLQNPKLIDNTDDGLEAWAAGPSDEQLRAQGYDGVIFQAGGPLQLLRGAAPSPAKGILAYAFSSVQIKSATGNRGTFNRKHRDITKLTGQLEDSVELRYALLSAVAKLDDPAPSLWQSIRDFVTKARGRMPANPVRKPRRVQGTGGRWLAPGEVRIKRPTPPPLPGYTPQFGPLTPHSTATAARLPTSINNTLDIIKPHRGGREAGAFTRIGRLVDLNDGRLKERQAYDEAKHPRTPTGRWRKKPDAKKEEKKKVGPDHVRGWKPLGLAGQSPGPIHAPHQFFLPPAASFERAPDDPEGELRDEPGMTGGTADVLLATTPEQTLFAEMKIVRVQRREGHNVSQVFRVTMEDSSQYAYKPITGERTDIGHNGVPGNGHQARAEVATFELSEVLGFGIVPPTSYVSVNGKPGSWKPWMAGTLGEGVSSVSSEDRDKATALSFLAAGTDMHHANWLALPSGKVQLFDTGLGFPVSNRTSIRIDPKLLQNSTTPISPGIHDAMKGKRALAVAVLRRNGLPEQSVELFKQRWDWLATAPRWSSLWDNARNGGWRLRKGFFD